MKLLVVDDEAIARRRLVRMLGRLGEDVVGEAANGQEALAKIATLRPDAVLFAESASRAVVSCAESVRGRLLELAGSIGVPIAEVGRTGGDRIRIEPGVDIGLAEGHDTWARTLPEALA